MNHLEHRYPPIANRYRQESPATLIMHMIYDKLIGPGIRLMFLVESYLVTPDREEFIPFIMCVPVHAQAAVPPTCSFAHKYIGSPQTHKPQRERTEWTHTQPRFNCGCVNLALLVASNWAAPPSDARFRCIASA